MEVWFWLLIEMLIQGREGDKSTAEIEAYWKPGQVK